MRKWKRHLVAALVGLYPARWKREYGEELRDVLLRRRLDAATAADAIWNAFRQQLRLGEPWLLVGVPWLVLNWAGYWWKGISYTLPYNFLDVSRPIFLPPLNLLDKFVPPLNLLVPLMLGYWTVTRDPIDGRGSRAAVKNVLLLDSPFFVGILGGRCDDCGQKGIYGWLILSVILLLQLMQCAALGWLGGLAARGQARFRRRRA